MVATTSLKFSYQHNRLSLDAIDFNVFMRDTLKNLFLVKVCSVLLACKAYRSVEKRACTCHGNHHCAKTVAVEHLSELNIEYVAERISLPARPFTQEADRLPRHGEEAS